MQELFPNVHQAVTTMSIGPMKFSAAMFAVKTEDELILIDAFELDDSETKELEALGTPTHTVITCVTHERDCDTYRKKYDAKIITHRDTVPKLEGSVDETFGDGETIVGGHYIMGWTLTIATYRAQTGATRGKRNRCSVQLILDWWSETGVDMILVRDVIAGDEKLPRHDADKDTAATVPKPCVAFPSVILSPMPPSARQRWHGRQAVGTSLRFAPGRRWDALVVVAGRSGNGRSRNLRPLLRRRRRGSARQRVRHHRRRWQLSRESLEGQ